MLALVDFYVVSIVFNHFNFSFFIIPIFTSTFFGDCKPTLRSCQYKKVGIAYLHLNKNRNLYMSFSL